MSLKIGIIREGKVPPDSRVPLTPKQCKYIIDNYPVEVFVQSSPRRCYKDEEYQNAGVPVVDNVANCDVLMGVKEVPIDQLLSNKTFFFFSHTIKQQSYNQKLLKAILKENIRLIDYEVLTNEKGKRLIAFGRFAGIVGAHNGVMTYGMRTGRFSLKRMKDCLDYNEAKAVYNTLKLPPFKTVVTGTGRVSGGAVEVLDAMNIRRVSAEEFLQQEFDEAVYTQLSCKDYVKHKSNNDNFDKADFYANPQDYVSIFYPYAQVADLMINGIYWDNAAPAFFTKEEMKNKDFNIQVIADVTCDIAPVSSIPSTLHASTIADPIFGYDIEQEAVASPHKNGVVDMMTIDNLPNEMPRDASESFGQRFIDSVLEELLAENSAVIDRATVAVNGGLGSHFDYLKEYAGLEVH